MVLQCGLGWLQENAIKVKALLNYLLWSSSENTAQARMNWDDCTMLKKVGGLRFTSLDDAM